jgi:phosphatidylserine decarboxylase
MYLHREGTPTLLLSTAALCFILFGLWRWLAWPLWILSVVTVMLLVIYAIVVLFFRVPRREANADGNSIVAPADGKVVAIEEVMEGEYFQDRRLQVSIFK